MGKSAEGGSVPFSNFPKTPKKQVQDDMKFSSDDESIFASPEKSLSSIKKKN